MPVFKSHSVLELFKGFNAFLNLDLGFTRGKVPDPQVLEAQARKLGEVRTQLKRQRGHLEEVQRQLADKERRIGELEKPAEDQPASVNPENIIWVLPVLPEPVAPGSAGWRGS